MTKWKNPSGANKAGLHISHIGHSMVSGSKKSLALRDILHVSKISKHLLCAYKVVYHIPLLSVFSYPCWVYSSITMRWDDVLSTWKHTFFYLKWDIALASVSVDAFFPIKISIDAYELLLHESLLHCLSNVLILFVGLFNTLMGRLPSN
jgi:hypothetical protein